jgi:hypothetical protein
MDVKSEPKGRLGLISSSRMVPRYCRSMICPATLTKIVSLVICSSL